MAKRKPKDETVTEDQASAVVADPETEAAPAEAPDQADPSDTQTEAEPAGPTATDGEVLVFVTDAALSAPAQASNPIGIVTEAEFAALAQNDPPASATLGADSVEEAMTPAAEPVSTVPAKARPKVRSLKLAEISRDPRIQPREQMQESVIREYAADMAGPTPDDPDKVPDVFPPVLVFHEVYEGNDIYWLADGWHRVYAAERAGVDAVKAEIREGGLNAAMIAAAGANAKHGLRRTNADKRRSVNMLLNHPQVIAEGWSDGSIARAAQVTREMVSSIRRAIVAAGGEVPQTRRGADGQAYTIRSGPQAARQEAATAPDEAIQGSDGEGAPEEAPGGPAMYECGSCDALTVEPSLHCETCGAHFPYAEYEQCPTCHPATAPVDGNGHAPVVATIASEPVTADPEAVGGSFTGGDGGGAIYSPGLHQPPTREHEAIRAVAAALSTCAVYAKDVDPAAMAALIDSDKQAQWLADLGKHLDWIDGFERAIQERALAPETA